MIYILWGVVVVILLLIVSQLRKVMSNQAQLAAALTAIAAQVAKIGTETEGLKAKVQELQDALNNAGNNTPEVEAALQALLAQVQKVDDLVPDAVQQTTDTAVANGGEAPAEPDGSATNAGAQLGGAPTGSEVQD